VRIAALLAGDVQAINNVPPSDVAQLRGNPAVEVTRAGSNTVLFLHMDSFRDQTPFATDKSGAPLPSNPFKDRRVRQAMSKAINRAALTERVMEGSAVPASQLLADGFFGVSPKLKPDAFDPAGARRLLAEAGYPNGFGLTIHGPNDRYVNDEKVLQAIAPMLIRAGIETKVVAQPWSVFISAASAPNYAYSVLLIGNGATTGENSFPLRSQFGTVDAATGMGSSNRARYSNPEVDRVLAQAMATVDDAKRDLLLQQVTEIAMADQAVVPLYYQDNVFATRKGVRYTPRADGYMAGYMLQPQ
jgi:peptide/nickel transport system substrate-binding protein